MKNILICVLILFVAGSCSTNGAKKLSDLEAANLKGEVLQVKESYHKVGAACCPGGDKNECSQIITIYNNNGYTVENLRIGIQGDTIQRSCHSYNELSECTSVENYSSNQLISIETNSIEDGLVQKVKVSDEKGILINTLLFDYQNGLLTGGETFDGKEKLVNSFNNIYRNGKMQTEIAKDYRGEVFSITRHKRNEHGDIVESTVAHPRDNSEFTVNYEYEYDKNGNWVKQTKIYNDDIISIRIREIKYQ